MDLIVAICGGSGAGKTTLVHKLVCWFGEQRVSCLAFDRYYRDLSHLSMQRRMKVNFDHPDSLDHELFIKHLEELRNGRAVGVPEYDFTTHTRSANVTRLEPSEVLILDGILLLNFQKIRALVDIAVFLDISEQLRFSRRMQRDVLERGRDVADIRRQFRATVAPMHDRFVQPSLAYADRVVTADESLDSVAEELASTTTTKSATTTTRNVS